MVEGERVIVFLLSAVFALSPTPVPDPNPYGDVSLLPTYVTRGDGTRLQCSPTADYCWPDTTGLPSYLVPS